jgi:hypothetical protein
MHHAAGIHAPLGKARSFAGNHAANSLAGVKKVTPVKIVVGKSYLDRHGLYEFERVAYLSAFTASQPSCYGNISSFARVMWLNVIASRIFSSCRSFLSPSKGDKVIGYHWGVAWLAEVFPRPRMQA